jgi:hypothetical protein
VVKPLTTPRLFFSPRALSPKLAVHPVQLRFGFAPWTKIPARGAAMGFTTGC